jgi:hypothetical protein
MKVIKIDARKKTITEIELDWGIKALYKELECEMFTCIELPNGDSLYIDDEGLLLDEPIGAFMLKGFLQPLSGHGLIIGIDDKTGESNDCKYTIEFIKKNVEFLPVQFLKGIPIQADFISLTDQEMEEYLNSGRLPIGKNPPSPQ